MSDRVRVLVVDDSALMRRLIPQILKSHDSIEVVGTAMDGSFALKKIEELKPDVVTLDLEMPRMDGIETLREIARRHRLPVIVVSAHTRDGARETLKALALGAVDFVAKPRDAVPEHFKEIANELAGKIKAAAVAGFPKLTPQVPAANPKAHAEVAGQRRPPTRVIAIGVSTGGPNALQYVFSQLPADFAGCLLVVQHMPEGFTEMLARRLNESSAVEVREARSGDPLLAGCALICPGNRHMQVRSAGQGHIAVLTDAPRVNGHRPSADVLFRSMAREFGPASIALLMTGMGEDGVAGIAVVKAAGGLALAQDTGSCAVSSMPRIAIERGYISHVIALESLASFLHARCAVPPRSSETNPLAPSSGRQERAGKSFTRRLL